MKATMKYLLPLVCLAATACREAALGSRECHARTPTPAVVVSTGCTAVHLAAIGTKGVGCTPDPTNDEVLYLSAGQQNTLDAVGCVADSETGQIFRTPMTFDVNPGDFNALRACTESERAIWAGTCR